MPTNNKSKEIEKKKWNSEMWYEADRLCKEQFGQSFGSNIHDEIRENIAKQVESKFYV